MISTSCPEIIPRTLEANCRYARLPSGASVKPDRSWTPGDKPIAKTMLSTILVAIKARKFTGGRDLSCLSASVLSEGPPIHLRRQQHTDPQIDYPTSASAWGVHV